MNWIFNSTIYSFYFFFVDPIKTVGYEVEGNGYKNQSWTGVLLIIVSEMPHLWTNSGKVEKEWVTRVNEDAEFDSG